MFGLVTTLSHTQQQSSNLQRNLDLSLQIMNEGFINFKEKHNCMKSMDLSLHFFIYLKCTMGMLSFWNYFCGKNNHFRRYWILRSLRCLFMSIPPFISAIPTILWHFFQTTLFSKNHRLSGKRIISRF